MKNKVLITVVFNFLLILGGLNAQEVEKSKLKFGGYGQKKFNDAEKKIYIEQFSISYQYIYAKSKKTKGGRQMGGGYLGDAKAALFLGLDGIEPEELQKLTDEAYLNFISNLKAKGYTILTGKDYKEHEYYQKAEVYEGGEQKQYYKGFISTAPTGVTFLNKGYGIFNTTLKTSKQLDGITVARVNIMVPFAEDGQSQGSKALAKTFGGVAKVVAKPNLRIGSSTIQAKSKLGFEKYNTITTNFDIGYKKGLKYQAWYTVNPKKGIIIDGVLPKKKYKAVKSASQDLDGTQIGNYRVFNIPEEELKKMQMISFDKSKYTIGVKEALDYFVGTSVDKFLSYIN
ncbi:MAG: hypothetical protein EVB11_08175 [Winogradskyella sp.]|nr:MAG: hypothetical protein EVB11_08175 [Winogradskyella sp.]